MPRVTADDHSGPIRESDQRRQSPSHGDGVVPDGRKRPPEHPTGMLPRLLPPTSVVSTVVRVPSFAERPAAGAGPPGLGLPGGLRVISWKPRREIRIVTGWRAQEMLAAAGCAVAPMGLLLTGFSERWLGLALIGALVFFGVTLLHVYRTSCALDLASGRARVRLRCRVYRFDISNITEIVLRDRTFERVHDQAALLRATTVYRIEARLRDGSSRRLATDIITRAPRSLPDHFKRLDRLAKALARECDVPFRFTERE